MLWSSWKQGPANLQHDVVACRAGVDVERSSLAVLTMCSGVQIKNVAAASNAALQHDVAFLQRETLELQSKLERSLQSFDTIQQEAQAVEGEVIDEVNPLPPCAAALQNLALLHCWSMRDLRPCGLLGPVMREGAE